MDRLWALVPLSLPLLLCVRLLDNPLPILERWVDRILLLKGNSNNGDEPAAEVILNRKDAFQSQLLAYMLMAFAGYMATARLVPNIQHYTLRKGIAGKDLGKRGTATADKPMCVLQLFHLLVAQRA